MEVGGGTGILDRGEWEGSVGGWGLVSLWMRDGGGWVTFCDEGGWRMVDEGVMRGMWRMGVCVM